MAKWVWFTFIVLVAGRLLIAEEPPLKTMKDGAAISIKHGDKVVAVYQLQPQKNTKLSVESGCYFHPLMTPAGVAVTEVGPADHPHHRGVFLAWVEMHGRKHADFWGWGEHAPKNDRRIVNRDVTKIFAGATGGFVATNQWLAEDEVVIDEQLRADMRAEDGANVLDLKYTLTPAADVKLARWAFSGFCVRTRIDGRLEAHGPDGAVNLPNPSHVKPESDWPAAAWYAYQLGG
ncbi:MAG: PmoA family protein, partial [Planctomycetota bacterium]|nr:PmoA family protein [Planctomycetota bacterium]